MFKATNPSSAAARADVLGDMLCGHTAASHQASKPANMSDASPRPVSISHNLTGVMCRCAVHALYTNPLNCPVKFSVLGGHSKISLCGK